MFGKKNRPLGSVERLEDLLLGIAGATDAPGGALRVEIPFRGEKRAGEVFVRCAEVSGLGPVAHVSAPISHAATPDAVAAILDETSRLAIGDVAVANGKLELRATIAFARATYADVVALFAPLAAAADELSRPLP